MDPPRCLIATSQHEQATEARTQTSDIRWIKQLDKFFDLQSIMRVLLGRQVSSASGTRPESLHAQRTCLAQKPFRPAVLGHINAPKAAKTHRKIYAASRDGPSSESRQNEDTLKLLDSLLGSMDEGEQARTGSAQRAASTSESDHTLVSETFDEEPASLHQLSAPTRGDVYTGIGPTRQVVLPPLAQTLIQNAKKFLADKLKRATAEDLIVDEDAVALPKIKPRVAYLLLAINVGVYAAGLVAGLGPEGADAQQDYFLALAKTDVGVEAGEYYRLITANFLHDSFVHLGSSCYALATVAPAIEEVLGWDIFLATYLLSSIGGSVGTFILGDAVTVGASSGIFGVIGALVAYLWKNRCLERTSQQLTSIAGVVGVNLVMGGIQETSIDNIGHAAGLLVGAYIGYGLSSVLLPRKDSSAGATASTSAKADEQTSEVEQIDVMHVDHSGALRRWAGYVSFATTLALLTAGTVVMRTGELPAPKALELLVFQS